MFTTKKQKAEQQHRSRERRRFEVARTIYSTIITKCIKSYSQQDTEKLPQKAARLTVIFSDALIAELEKKWGKQ